MLIKLILFIFSLISLSSQTAVQEAFRKNNIDIVPVPPEKLLKVTYANNLQVNLGNELKPSQVKDDPVVFWEAEPNDLYCIVCTDPDPPDPALAEIKHWLVVNIKGNDISSGKMIAAYRGSGPPIGSGLHRYIFLVYKQTKPIDDDLPIATKNSRNGRIAFKVAQFAEKYNLGVPIYGNFFKAQYEEGAKLG